MRFHQWRRVTTALQSWRAPAIQRARFSSSAIAAAKKPKQKPLPPKPTVDDNDLIENFLRGSGPGGQKINKTTSAVQLIHIPTGLVVKSQDTRSRSQNRVIARKRLAEALDEREHGEASRSAIKRDRQSKKKSSRAKKSRRKYRKLEEEKSRQEGGAAVGEEDGDGLDEHDDDDDQDGDDSEVSPGVERTQDMQPETPKSNG